MVKMVKQATDLEGKITREPFSEVLVNVFMVKGKDGSRHFDTSWYYPLAIYGGLAMFFGFLVAVEIGKLKNIPVHYHNPTSEHRLLDETSVNQGFRY